MQFYDKITLDERWFFAIVLVVALSLLTLLTLNMRSGYLAQLDQSVLASFHKMKTPSLDHFFSGITWLGSLWVLLPLYILLTLSLSRHFDNVEKILGIGFWGAVITTYFIKYTLERKRPHFFSTINELPIDPSYPSAHTAQIVAFLLLLWLIVYTGHSLFNTLLTVLFFSIAIGVSASRMYLQVHFPSDVLAGALIGIIWTCIAVLAVKSGALR